jgi:hypothetical protein
MMSVKLEAGREGGGKTHHGLDRDQPLTDTRASVRLDGLGVHLPARDVID